MNEDSPETAASSAQPCNSTAFNPMIPSTSRVAPPSRSSSRMSNRPYPASPFRAQPQNMEPSNSRVQELRDAAVGKRSYTNDWMQNGYAVAPGMQQSQQQRPPSMMGSNMSTISNMSNMSEMTMMSYGGLSVLSVNTELGACDWYGQSQQALSRVGNALSTENQDPKKAPRPMTVAEIVQNLKSNEMALQSAALRKLEAPLSNPLQVEFVWSSQELQSIIDALFEVLVPKPVEHENVIYITLQLLYRSIMNPARTKIDKMFVNLNKELMDPHGRRLNGVTNPCSIYDIVSSKVSRVDTKYETAAACLLTHLCCKPYFMRYVFSDNAKMPSYNFQQLHLNMISFAVQLLGRVDAKPKTRGFAVSIIKNLTQKNKMIMAKALEMDVVRIFLETMKNEQIHEDLLWTTMRSLNSFCRNPSNGDRFIRLGGAQVLCSLLSHGSTRLLHELLGCMKQIADLPAIQEQNMEESIHYIVQVIGSSDSTIVERSTATLRNIAFHNKNNKTFMVNNGVTSHALAVLRTSAQYTYQSNGNQEAVRQEISSIYENCLSILNNVTSMSPQDRKESAFEACRMISQNADAAGVLHHFFNVGNRKCRKMAVSVIKRVIDTVPAFADPFVDLTGTRNDAFPVLLLQRIYQSLEDFRKISMEIVQSGIPQDHPNRPEMDIRRKDHEDIVKRSVSLLTTLCTKCNPRFFQSVTALFSDQGFNPFAWLTHEMSDAILVEWLTFILEFCNVKEAYNGCYLFHLMQRANNVDQLFMQLYERRQSLQIQNLIRNISTVSQEMKQRLHAQQQIA